MRRTQRFGEKEKQIIFDKLKGHCHFCGDQLIFEHRGRKPWPPLEGQWEIDHIVQLAKGGIDEINNNLPICAKCNRLRWHRKGEDLRRLLWLGLIAKDEILNNTDIGKQIEELSVIRANKNAKRRKQ